MNESKVIIIGGGPIGMACAIELKERGVESTILEKGAPAENIRRWPQGMTFFSTPEKINLADIPFTSNDMRPTREEALKYYHAVSEYFDLDIRTNTLVTNLQKMNNQVVIKTEAGDIIADKVILATGYYDQPNYLGIEGENQPNVTHYLRDPYKYLQSRVMVVGGSHSAADAALTLYRLGAEVVMVHRQPQLREKLKYWIKPDLENRIAEGAIEARFSTDLQRIDGNTVYLLNNETGEEGTEDVDFVLLLTGYMPNVALLQSVGVTINPDSLVPEFDETTFESNVEGIYLAGSLTAGRHVSQIFIENGREHAKAIAEAIAEELEKVEA